MAVGIAFRFPAGRYHATPWGHHVNEGVLEWPPAPWRLLRALAYSWKVKTFSADEEAFARMLAALVEAPDYYLPPASTGHTRHYMPLFRGERTLVFDSFIALCPDAELVAIWPGVQLDEPAREVLSQISANLNYLGRAESWCVARLMSTDELARIDPNSRPLDDSADLTSQEYVRVLAADPNSAVDLGKPAHLWNLCAESATLRKERWSDPPGSRWLTYLRPTNCFAPQFNPRVLTRRGEIKVARFSLTGTVLPLATETLSTAEYARRRIQGVYGAIWAGASSETFSGRAPDGERLRGHRHAFFLPTDEDLDGRLDHLTIYSRTALNDKELQALDHARGLHQAGGKPELKMTLVGLGTPDDFNLIELFRPSRIWRSHTPFVPMRHSKVRGGVLVETPQDQLLSELRRRGYPYPVSIREMPRHSLRDRRSVRWIEFRQERSEGGGRRGSGVGGGYQIEFSEVQVGPIALGYGCHFGLGQFHATKE